MSRVALLLAGIALPLAAARADEGMWTFDAFPTREIPRRAWLGARPGVARPRPRRRRSRSAAARRASSRRSGLLLTNHHCAVSCLQDVSDKGNDLVANGFTARARADEKMCPGLQAEVVTSIRDVTAASEGARSARRPAKRRSRRAPRRSRDRKGRLPRHRHDALPGRHLVRRRPVQALHQPQIFRRPARLGARGRGADLRRRPRQLQLPALRARCVVPARLRERQAGGDAAAPQMDRARAEGGRADLRRRLPWPDRAHADAEPVRLPARGQPTDRAGDQQRASRPPDRGDEAEPRQGPRGRESPCSASRTTSSAPSAERARSAIPLSTRCSRRTRPSSAPKAPATPRSAIRGARSTAPSPRCARSTRSAASRARRAT